MQLMTEASATKIAKEWSDDLSSWGGPLPTGYSQASWMIKQITKLCIAEAVKQNKDEDGFREILSEAYEIISAVWRETAPAIATKYWDKDKEKPSADEQKQIDTAKKTIWVRHDPMKSFNEGYTSKNHISFDKGGFNSVIADYLARPWLRIAVLDWILLDITITGELCAYGEALKRDWLPGPRGFLGMNNRYYKANGNLTELKKVDWKYTGERINVWFWSTIGVPVGIIWAAFHFGFESTGEVLLGIFIAIWLVVLLVKVGRWIMRVLRPSSGKVDPTVQAFELWDKMYEVWKLLEGPVVNPARVREVMQKTTEVGAVWDTVSWSLIDKVILSDPAVWIVEPGH